jgi:hypothetical protein
MSGSEHDIWEIQPDETSKSYQAFCVYRDMGCERSFAKAYRLHTGRESAVNANGTWQGWAAAHNWFERAKAYDVSLLTGARKEREAEHRKKLEAYSKRQLDLSVATLTAAIGLLKVANERLKSLKPEEITPKTLASIYRAAAAVGVVSGNSEAQSLGVDDLAAMLENEDEG